MTIINDTCAHTVSVRASFIRPSEIFAHCVVPLLPNSTEIVNNCLLEANGSHPLYHLLQFTDPELPTCEYLVVDTINITKKWAECWSTKNSWVAVSCYGSDGANSSAVSCHGSDGANSGAVGMRLEGKVAWVVGGIIVLGLVTSGGGLGL
jgi:hypothetical protein